MWSLNFQSDICKSVSNINKSCAAGAIWNSTAFLSSSLDFSILHQSGVAVPDASLHSHPVSATQGPRRTIFCCFGVLALTFQLLVPLLWVSVTCQNAAYWNGPTCYIHRVLGIPIFPFPILNRVKSGQAHWTQADKEAHSSAHVNTHSHTDEDKRTLESMRRWVMLKSLAHWWNKRTLSSHVVPGQFRAVVSSQISCHFQRANQQSGHQTFWHPVATVSTQDASFNGISCVSNDQTLKSQSTQHLGQVSQLHFCQVSWIEEVVCG